MRVGSIAPSLVLCEHQAAIIMHSLTHKAETGQEEQFSNLSKLNVCISATFPKKLQALLCDVGNAKAKQTSRIACVKIYISMQQIVYVKSIS